MQPGNVPSSRLVARMGFRKEGFSPRYLHIDGDWRDHRLFAITREQVPLGLLHRYEQSLVAMSEPKSQE